MYVAMGGTLGLKQMRRHTLCILKKIPLKHQRLMFHACISYVLYLIAVIETASFSMLSFPIRELFKILSQDGYR